MIDQKNNPIIDKLIEKDFDTDPNSPLSQWAIAILTELYYIKQNINSQKEEIENSKNQINEIPDKIMERLKESRFGQCNENFMRLEKCIEKNSKDIESLKNGHYSQSIDIKQLQTKIFIWTGMALFLLMNLPKWILALIDFLKNKL